MLIHVARRKARVRVTAELLLDALKFPEGTDILACHDELIERGTVELVLSHPDLPIVCEGCEPPFLVPLYERIEFDWNLDDPVNQTPTV